MDSFRGRVAVVTGGASGIGLVLASRAASAGMDVVLADIEDGPLDAATTQVRSTPGARPDIEVVTRRTDVSRADDVDALAESVFERFGAVHLLCNNAGVGGGGLQAELSVAEWNWVLGVNLHGVIHGIASFLPRMLASGEEGHIVNTASMAGHVAAPGMGPYNASKYAVVGLSESLYKEQAGSCVGVSVLCPGWVKTNITTSGRNRPADLPERPVAAANSERADFIRQAVETGLAPSAVAELVFDAVANRRFWIFTAPEMLPAITARANGAVAGENPAV